MNLNKLQEVFSWGVLLIFLTPLFIFPWIFYPFQTATSLSFLVLVELLFPLFLFLLFQSSRRISLPFLLKLLGVYFFTFLVVSFLGVDFWNSFWGNAQRPGGLFLLGHVFVFTLYVYYAYLWSGITFFYRAVRLIVVVSVLAATYGLLEGFQFLPSLAEHYLPRASSFFGNPSFFGVYLLLPFWFAAWGMRKEVRFRYWYLFAMLLIGAGIVASGTRAAMLALFLSVLFSGVLFLFEKKVQSQKWIWGSGVGFLIVMSVMLVYGRVFAADRTLFHRMTHLTFGTSSQRLNYWWTSLKGFLDQPFLGVGYENFYFVANKYFKSDFYAIAGTWPDKPHNVFLELLTTGGIVVFLAFLLFLFFWVKILCKHHERMILLPALVSYLVSAFFLFDGMFFWTSLALLLVFSLKDVVVKEHSQVISSWISQSVVVVSAMIVLFVIWFVIKPQYLQAYYTQGAYYQSVEDVLSLGEISCLYDLPFASRVRVNQFSIVNQASSDVRWQYHDDLVNAYDKALNRHSLNAQLLTQAASYYVHRVEYGVDMEVNPLASEYLSQARLLAPERVEPLIALARIAQLEGRLEDGIELLEGAVERADRDPQALVLLGEQYLVAGRVDEAAIMFFRSINAELPDKEHQVSFWLIEYYLQQNDPATLLVFLRRLIQLHPEEILFYEMLVGAYDSFGMMREAQEIARHLQELNHGSNSLIETYLAE